MQKCDCTSNTNVIAQVAHTWMHKCDHIFFSENDDTHMIIASRRRSQVANKDLSADILVDD